MTTPIVESKRPAPDCEDHLPTIRLTVPNSDVPRQYAKFAGIWRGKWGGKLCSAFVVVSVEKDGEILYIYSWANGVDHDGSKFDGGHSVGTAKILNRAISFGSFNVFTFRMNEGGDLVGVRLHKKTGKKSHVTMQRVVAAPVKSSGETAPRKQSWGAIAVGSRGRVYGFSYGRKDMSDAQVVAMEACNAKTNNCKIRQIFQNCIAVARDYGWGIRSYWITRNSITEARSTAKRLCDERYRRGCFLSTSFCADGTEKQGIE